VGRGRQFIENSGKPFNQEESIATKTRRHEVYFFEIKEGHGNIRQKLMFILGAFEEKSFM